LQPFFDIFPSDQIFVVLYDSLCQDPRDLLRRIYEFLGVNADFLPESWNKHFNVATDSKPGVVTRSRGYLISLLNRRLLVGVKNFIVRRGLKDIRYYGVRDSGSYQHYATLSESTRRELSAILQPDLKRLEKLANLDLSVWSSFGHRDRES
jgi:hypothetical protein